MVFVLWVCLAALGEPAPESLEAHVAALDAQLAAHERALTQAEWPRISRGGPLSLGDRGPRVAELRARLLASGALTTTSTAPEVFDAELAAALARVQERLGLEGDGVFGPHTAAALALSPQARLQQVGQARAQLSRFHPSGSRALVINIPSFHLELWEGTRTVFRSKVVVGRPDRPTPTLSSTITEIVLNPHWWVPGHIFGSDLLARFRADPGLVERQGFIVLDRAGKTVDPKTIDWESVPADAPTYRLCQEPGPSNALGRIKLLFSNAHGVYLHDTASPELFQKPRRAFSSGCVRVERALELAEQISPGVTAHLEGPDSVRVALPEPLAIHIVYWLAETDDEGGLELWDDVYGRSRAGRGSQALGERAPQR